MTTQTPSGVFDKACWIWPDNFSTDIHNCYAQFRKAFELKGVPKKAPLFITADQSYRLYINGRYVCRGPARGFQSHWPYDEVDVAGFLCKGRNVLAVRAFNPGRSSFSYLTQGYAGLLVAAKWGGFTLTSDGTWRSRRQRGVARGTVPLSMQLFDQEHVDLALEQDDWMLPDYDDTGWEGLSQARRFGTMPWCAVEPRMIPMLDERIIKPTEVIGVGEGANVEGYRTARDVVALRLVEDRAHVVSAGGPLPFKVKATGQGRYRSCLIDFGHTVVGSLTLKVQGARGGEIVDMMHVETIEADTLKPHLEMPTWCRMAIGNRMVCRQGENHHEFYHPLGFRYVDLIVRDADADLEIDVELNWVGYPLERKGSFSSSDEALSRIWDISAWTQQCCALDAYVDTPWREQAQWWGDARVQAWNTFHLNGDSRLLRRGIHCIAGQTTPDGVTYGHAPTMAHECILPDFTLTWILTLWDYYWQTGSVEPVKTHAAVLDGVLDYFRRHTDAKTGLVGYDSRYWLFLDWTEIFKEGYSAVYNLWLLMALDKLVILFKKAGDAKKARAISVWAAKVRKALRVLINDEGLLRDGITFDGRMVETTCIHSQTLAILNHLHPAGEKVMVERVLAPYIRGERVEKGQPSSYWCTYVFTVLTECGYGKDVVEFIRKKWLPMVAHGTTFEVFDPVPGSHSCSHAWSAHPLYHLMKTIGGITQTAPVWKKFRFEPVFVGDNGGAVIPSPQGKIVGKWMKRSGRIDVSLTLPPGVTATVILPDGKPLACKGRGKWTVMIKEQD